MGILFLGAKHLPPPETIATIIKTNVRIFGDTVLVSENIVQEKIDTNSKAEQNHIAPINGSEVARRTHKSNVTKCHLSIDSGASYIYRYSRIGCRRKKTIPLIT